MPAPPPAGPPPPPQAPLGQPWQPRFNLFTLMLVMFVISVLGAGLFYVVRGIQSPQESGGFALIFVLAAPVLMLVVMSVLWQVYKWGRGEDE